jgi:hypothetical protein
MHGSAAIRAAARVRQLLNVSNDVSRWSGWRRDVPERQPPRPLHICRTWLCTGTRTPTTSRPPAPAHTADSQTAYGETPAAVMHTLL